MFEEEDVVYGFFALYTSFTLVLYVVLDDSNSGTIKKKNFKKTKVLKGRFGIDSKRMKRRFNSLYRDEFMTSQQPLHSLFPGTFFAFRGITFD